MARTSLSRAVTGAVLAAGLAVALAPVAAASPESAAASNNSASGWTPFFDSGSLKDSGWANCPEPIVLTVDPRALPVSQRKSAKDAFATAVKNWAQQSGMRFTFGGVTPINYNDATAVISPVDGVDRQRHMYITVLADNESQFLSQTVIGFAMPTTVQPANKEITQAEGAFRVDYVGTAKKDQRVAVFMHELGHALGLGHSTSKGDIMYPYVDNRTKLGAGDIAGIKAVMRPCTTPPTP